MKKLMTLLMMLMMATLLVACGGDDTAEDAGEDTGSDATSAPTKSDITDEASLLEAVENGGWIVIFTDDMETSEELVLTPGEHNGEPARKLALYTQDEDRVITDQFTLTTPKLTVQGENTRIQGGTVKGDVYVEANNFSIPDGTIDGNLYFASEEYEASADLSGGTVTGSVEVAGADVTTAPTQSNITDEASLLEAVENGGWIVIFTDDMETSEELVLTPGEQNGEPARKLALYTQDEDRVITDQYTLTTPKLTVQGENTRIQGGTVKGDVYVEANNFSIPDGTIDGNLYFASEEYEASADLSGGTVTGSVEVQ
ncbi:hypothetical protein GCM10012290_20430 [Halolactibacillus alkaliphilus]|uniref:hypothetical protein n=1 Tax=Halolactibacillus alkaliphilus TaxID=442899 RepID=UPI0008E80C12|nr:hypothetical protein [Halolactibacillus alkaliphilus]GGN73497.1 hypothetical protein GCM10012290_20430 [Halolactibacillus alkaliphilus]SFO97174.1 hypothetical protein SAMN05720591_12719 [Halolactibacillus alkaliphilus]